MLVNRSHFDRLPELLRSVDVAAKRTALARVWNRVVWRETLNEPLRSRLPSPDAFEATVESLGALLARRGMLGGASRGSRRS